MGTVLIQEDNLVKLAGVIRRKNGTSRNYHPDEMAEAILELPTDGSAEADETTVDILNDTVTVFTDPDRKIRTIGTYAMYNAANLQSVDLPACSSVQAYGFAGCTHLESINLPNCTSIGAHAFNGCTALTTISSNRIGSIGDYGFAYSTFSEYHTASGGGIGNYAFYNNTHLTECTFGGAVSFYISCFAGCTNLENITLSGGKSSIYNQASATSLFNGTKVLTSGHIYVPANLIDKYLEDPSWQPVASRITAIPQPEPSPEPEGGA